MILIRHVGLAATVLLVLAACGQSGNAPPKPAVSKPAPVVEHVSEQAPSARPDDAANIDGDRIIHADDTPGDWLAHGRTYSEQRFSPLKDIDRGTVKQL